MKNEKFLCKVDRCFVLLMAVTLCIVSGCAEKVFQSEGDGFIRLSFGNDYNLLTRAGLQLPDTCDFHLVIKQSDGKIIYSGRYGDSPERIGVAEGQCTVSVISCQFDKPAFDSPQFGDEQVVMVPTGGDVAVRLLCKQKNSGIKLKIDKAFLTSYPQSVLFLKDSDSRLMYAYLEKRFAFFPPGNISLVMITGQSEQVLLSRPMFAGEMLTISVNVSGGTSSGTSSPSADVIPNYSGIGVSVDTSRVWANATCLIGGKPGSGSGSSGGGGNIGNGPIPDNALTINDAKALIGSKGVWVSAYVVGGDLSSKSAKYEPPFTSQTNLLLGPRSVIDNRSTGMSVFLPTGPVRMALNLVEHPGILRKKIMVKGDVVASYYGLVGLKNVTDYRVL